MLGAPWVTGDMDIYVPFGTFGTLLRGYLMKEEGYKAETLQPVTSKAEGYIQLTHPPTLMKNVYQLSKTVTDASGQPTTISIDIIESSTSAAIAPIFRFHSSAVMNWISGDGFCMTYPHLTCDNIGIVNQLQYSTAANVGKWRAKYIERGFKFYDSPAEIVDRNRPCGVACPLITRSTEDIGCMIYNFNSSSEEEKVRAVTWKLYESGLDQPAVKCLNPYCPRSFSMLNKRAGGSFADRG